ncbi:histidine kinase [Limnospira fusiformis KN01]|uniref:GAF domain-containing protein n=1 Tax=Limnospira fusiformis PMC 851.14 TaxID=2219512 RepID=A0ABU9EU79_LIMFS|nr:MULTISPECIES: GAF domain-containing protein [Limnospira]EKD05982.1 multi-sensor signal transduction histidine kinase [Arthrospira platensis C1]MBD2668290.1 histidine kinase [Arthrospira platensis FACHB-439]MDT9197239.1 histidine kinase [Limnospira sp. PMC 1042.18]MDT9232653.1 histidine kinase [Limnospira sp. PMC 917.15]MDT9273567.1 histidine kinase [Limnospira sp. PMC 737.11]
MNNQPFRDLNSKWADQVRNGCQELRDSDEIRQTWDHIIATMALRIRRSLKLKEILQTTADEVQRLLKCDRVLLYEIDLHGNGGIVVEAVEDERWSLE